MPCLHFLFSSCVLLFLLHCSNYLLLFCASVLCCCHSSLPSLITFFFNLLSPDLLFSNLLLYIFLIQYLFLLLLPCWFCSGFALQEVPTNQYFMVMQAGQSVFITFTACESVILIIFWSPLWYWPSQRFLSCQNSFNLAS